MFDFNPGQTLLIVLVLFAVIYGRRAWRWLSAIRADWSAFQMWKQTQPLPLPISSPAAVPSRPDEVLAFEMTTISREQVPGAGGALLNPPARLDTARAYLHQYVPHGRMSFPIGWWGDDQLAHLAVGHFIGDIYNILVTAMPGSGKDNLILNMAYTLMHEYSPHEIQFFVMDGKGGADYLDWSEKQHVFHIAEEGYQLAEAMTLLSAIKLERKRWLKQARVSSWDNYQGPDRPPLMVVVISELTQLLEVMPRSEVESWLMREVNVWRGLGLRLVVGTQNTSGWSKEWRAAMECFFAGLQPSGDEVRPNTGKTIKELDAMGVVPPHQLPNVRGLFTAVHRSTAVNVRSTYLDDDQRALLTLRLPDRTPDQHAALVREKARLCAEWDAFQAMIEAGETSSRPMLTEQTVARPAAQPPVAAISPGPERVSELREGYDRQALEAVLAEIQQDRTRRLEELVNEPVFLRACVVEYARCKSNSGVVKAIWGNDKYSGTKDRVVKAALESAAQQEQRGLLDDGLLQGLLAA